MLNRQLIDAKRQSLCKPEQNVLLLPALSGWLISLIVKNLNFSSVKKSENPTTNTRPSPSASAGLKWIFPFSRRRADVTSSDFRYLSKFRGLESGVPQSLPISLTQVGSGTKHIQLLRKSWKLILFKSIFRSFQLTEASSMIDRKSVV